MLPEPNSPVQPDEFIGRRPEIEAFRFALQQGLLTGRTASFAVLGDRGTGKSSLLSKFAAVSAEPTFGMLPVFLSAPKDTPDYLGLAECLLDNFAEALANVPTLPARLRAELQNWRLKQASWRGIGLDREASPFFLSSGSALLRHSLTEAWRRFVQPAHFRGAIFFLDDLHNITSLSKQDLALMLRDQFQWFGIEDRNYSVCFSARPDYFSWVRNLAEPAVRFYERLYLAPFTLEETNEYVQAVFGSQPGKTQELTKWLYKKTIGHPYFLAFLSQQLLAQARGSPAESPARLWPGIFRQLKREKFSSDLAQLSKKEIELYWQPVTRDGIQPGAIRQEVASRVPQQANGEGFADPHRTRSLQTLPPALQAVPASTKAMSKRMGSNAQRKQRFCNEAPWRPQAATGLPDQSSENQGVRTSVHSICGCPGRTPFPSRLPPALSIRPSPFPFRPTPATENCEVKKKICNAQSDDSGATRKLLKIEAVVQLLRMSQPRVHS